MTRTEHKRANRTKFHGQCGFGGLTWTERVRTHEQANRADRHRAKAELRKVVQIMTKYYYRVAGDVIADTEPFGKAWKVAKEVAKLTGQPIFRTVANDKGIRTEFFAKGGAFLPTRFWNKDRAYKLQAFFVGARTCVLPRARAEVSLYHTSGHFVKAFFAGKLHKFDPEILYTLSIEILVQQMYTYNCQGEKVRYALNDTA